MGRSWWAVLVGGGVLVVAGALLDTREFLILGAAAVAAAGAAAVMTRRPVHLDVRRTISPDRVSVGEPAALMVEAENLDPNPSPTVLGRHDLGDGAASLEFVIDSLPPGASQQWTLPLDTSRRGAFRMGPVELSNSDPLRLLDRGRSSGDSLDFFVLPRIHPLSLPSATSRRDLDGSASDRAANGSEAFHALRPYTSGDDHRTIHWRSSARRGELVVKQFVDLWQPDIVIVVDDDRDHYDHDERFEICLEAAASLVSAAFTARYALSLMLGTAGNSSTRAGSTQHAGPMDLLAGAQLGEGDGLAQLARALPRRRTDRMVILLTGDAPEDEVISFLSAARGYQRRIVVRFVDGVDDGESIVERSGAGDEAIASSGIDGFLRGWQRLVA